MNKQTQIFLTVIFSLIAISPAFSKSNSTNKNLSPNNARYKIQTNQCDTDVIASSPQKLLSLKNKKDLYIIQLEVTDCTGNINAVQFDKTTPINEYLLPTELIDFENPLIKELSQKLSLDKMTPVQKAKTALMFTKSAIQYDNELAHQISLGTCNGRSASETLAKGQGTCGEYTNVFIALMRLNKIPCKFITGIYINPQAFNSKKQTNKTPNLTLHAWAEFYDSELGWISCDPQAGFLGTSKNHVKLLEGSDFTNCGADFSNLYLDVSPLSN